MVFQSIDTSLNEFDANGVQTRFATYPYGTSETRQERLDRWQKMGNYDPLCQGCKEFRDHPTLSPFAPAHAASGGCRSGGYAHCTCDTCF